MRHSSPLLDAPFRRHWSAPPPKRAARIRGPGRLPHADDHAFRRRTPGRTLGLADGHARGVAVHACARIGGRELPSLFPRDAGVPARARAARHDADRHGRAAADGRLPAVRRRRAVAARGRRPRAARAGAGPAARIPAAVGPRHDDVPRGARRGQCARTLPGRARRARAFPAHVARRRAAALRRGAAAPRTRPVPRLVHRAPPEPRARRRAAAVARPRVRA